MEVTTAGSWAHGLDAATRARPDVSIGQCRGEPEWTCGSHERLDGGGPMPSVSVRLVVTVLSSA